MLPQFPTTISSVIVHGLAAQPREYIVFQPGDDLEGVRRAFDFSCCLNLPVLGGVDIIRQQLAGSVSTFASILQPDVGVDAVGKCLLVAVELVLLPPIFRAVRMNEQE